MENKKDIILDASTVESNPKIIKDSVKKILPENDISIGNNYSREMQVNMSILKDWSTNEILRLESKKKEIEKTITDLREKIKQIDDLNTYKTIYMEATEYQRRHS